MNYKSIMSAPVISYKGKQHGCTLQHYLLMHKLQKT